MKNILLIVFSTGWIAPLLLICYLLLSYLKNTVPPLLQNSKEQLNSFPYLHTIELLLIVTTIWFAIVILAWSIYFLKQSYE